MLFNSIDFAIFLPAVFFLYWFVSKKNLNLQNFIIVISSYLFYGLWDWRFLSLILFSTTIDYYIANKLDYYENKKIRKLLLFISIFINISFLGFFKYYNFFLDNFISTFLFFGIEIKANSLNIILPVGISFYTFQTLSYSIDIYNRKLKPTKNFIAFAAFVSFFPQLVAGPIERATHLLPQFHKKREFDYSKAVDGMRQILWGLFKKIVIADNCAKFANLIFNNHEEYTGSTLVLGALFFAFQIYGDFSGYSDIAIGTSKLFGFNILQNFKLPYFSKNIAEFWKRWHISLTSWFRDYIYIPMGGNRVNNYNKIRNIFFVFILSAFWHGANWTFILWGILHAFYFLINLQIQKIKINIHDFSQHKIITSLKKIISNGLTFSLVTFAWIFFRAENINHAFSYIVNIFSKSLFITPDFNQLKHALICFALVLLMLICEFITRKLEHPLKFNNYLFPRKLRWLIYLTIILLIINYPGEKQDFIYFQF